MYHLLVEDEYDIIGHIAYALYKEEKLVFVREYKESHGGKCPSDEDMQVFALSCKNETAAEKYKTIATSILGNFIDASLSEAMNKAEIELKENQMSDLREVVKDLKPMSIPYAYLHGIAQGIIGTIIGAIALGAVIFFLKFQGEDLKITISGGNPVKIEAATEAPQ